MAMYDEIPERDAPGLRDFGLVTGGLLGGLFGLFFPWLLGAAFPFWPWVVAGGLAAVALVYPPGLRPVYHGWMRFGLALGWVSSRIVLGVLFFCLFTPVGCVLRLRGHDSLARTFDRSAPSYRIPSRTRPIHHMERPF